MGEDTERGSSHDAADSEARGAGQAKEDVGVPWFINVMLALAMIAVGYVLRGWSSQAYTAQAVKAPASAQVSYPKARAIPKVGAIPGANTAANLMSTEPTSTCAYPGALIDGTNTCKMELQVTKNFRDVDCDLFQGDKDDDSIAWKLVCVYSADPVKVEKQ